MDLNDEIAVVGGSWLTPVGKPLAASQSGVWAAPGASSVDFWPHPFMDEGRRVVVCPAGWTLAEAMEPELAPWMSAVATVNGAMVARERWHGVVLNPEDVVQVRVVPRRDALRIVLSLLIVVGAAFLGPAVAGYLGITSKLGIALITAGIGIVGTLLLNVLFPPRLPEVEGGAKFERQYTLSGGANRLRPHEPLQLLFGTHRMFPDLVSKEYTEFDGENEQYLNQLFDFGIGWNLERSNYRIGDTPLSDFDDVIEQGTVDSAGHITLVAENVDTIAGVEFDRDTLTVTRRTAADTTRVAFDISAQVFRVSNRGRVQGRKATFQLEWRRVGASSWNLSTQALTTPNGGEGRNEVQRRTIVLPDLNEAPIDPPGEFEVRCTVSHIGDTALSTGLDDVWPEDDDKLTVRLGVHFKAYGKAKADFTGRNPYALRIRASGQLSGRVEQLNCDGSQRIPAWNGTTWVPDSVTSNPGDILLQWFRGWSINGNTVAGYGLPDTQIDITRLQQFADHCRAQSLECNLVLEDDRDEDQVATLIAQCGWGRINSAGGKYSVIWEEANRPVTAVITPDNIILDSMQVMSDAENLADTFVGIFMDRESGYVENQIERPVDVSNPTREFPIEIKLEGVTSGDAAAREINRAAAANFYHWRAYKWEMTGEGFSGIGIGDVVAMANGITGEGEGIALDALSADRRTVTPANDVTATSGSAWVWLLNNAVLSTTFTKQSDGTVLLSDAIPEPEDRVEDVLLDYRMALFPSSEPYRHVRVTAIEPIDVDRFRYTARDDIPEYYAARTRDLDHPLLSPSTADISPVQGFSVTTVGNVRRFSWTAREGALGYEIRFGGVGSVFGAMQRINTNGLVTESPYDRNDVPSEGTYRFGIVALLPRNGRTSPSYVTATLPEAGQLSDAFGIEYVFALSAVETIPESQLPSNDWGFEEPGISDGLVWRDDAPGNLSPSTPYLKRSQRKAQAGLEVGDPVEDEWTEPKTVGGEGAGYEEIFARTATPNIPNDQLPSDSWGYLQPQTRNGLAWTDEADDTTEALPYGWRARRRVPGYPAPGTTVPATWDQPRIVARYGSDGQDGLSGIPGADGFDGNGKEWIFARTATPNPPSLPLNSWAYDSVTTPWSDAAPTASATFPYIWQCQRDIRGRSTVISNWTSPRIVFRYGTDGTDGNDGLDGIEGADGVDGNGFEYVFTRTSNRAAPASQPDNDWDYDRPESPWSDAAPSLTSVFNTLHRAQRRVPGSTLPGQPVTALWDPSSIVSEIGPPGEDYALENGAIQTVHVAEGAITSTTILSGSPIGLGPGNHVVASRTIPGGAGFVLVVTVYGLANVPRSDDENSQSGTVGVRVKYNGLIIRAASAPVFEGRSADSAVVVATVSRAHTSSSLVEVEAWASVATSFTVTARMEVFKR